MSSNILEATSLVMVDGNSEEIARMLNYRWKMGWKLDRIISHGSENVLIYYFVNTKLQVSNALHGALH